AFALDHVVFVPAARPPHKPERILAEGAQRLEMLRLLLQGEPDVSAWDTELGHHRRYNRRTLRTVVEAAGFQVDSVAYLFPELLPLLPVRKLRRSTRSDVDFPQLGPLLTRAGYRISTATTKLRRVWPSGTSVLLTATNPAADDPESVDRG
ncbi:MAG: hypothetical protein AAB131_11265, partial [Actinomycetota bacterium]